MAEQKQDDSFRVIDRRMFTEDGQLRREAIEEERREQAVAAKSPPPAEPAAPIATAEAAVPASSLGFRTLIAFLARNAELVLAGTPDPRSGQLAVDVEGLHQLIDMMDALREKTAGRLAKDEDEMLQGVIGDLKYTYVQLTQQVARAAGQRNPTSRKP